jgi:molybdopterin-guanine dinucleotide biosynthesis protein A
MNTIPTIFNERRATYTVVGGTRRAGSTGLAAVLLNRGGRYLRRNVFEELEKVGFDLVVSVEGPRESFDLEELSIRFPSVKFLSLQESVGPGEAINLALDELPCERFAVLWNDLRPVHGMNPVRVVERLAAEPALCAVPSLQNGRFETLPTLVAPAFYKGSVKTVLFAPARDGAPSLYPFDYVGVYDRERFVRLGGFDPTIVRPYWQLLDFGFRAQLWGESIRSATTLRLRYEGDIPAEDATVDEGYKLFYLKNLAPCFRGDQAHLPIRRFFSYLSRSGAGPVDAWKEYAEARRWVNVNRYRFICDARRVTELWENPEP